MSCYICLESEKPLIRKTCGCKMLVHKKCFEEELKNGNLTCSVCHQKYKVSVVHYWPMMLMRAFFTLVLAIDEIIILQWLRLSLLITFTALYINVCIGLSMYSFQNHKSIIVHAVLHETSPSTSV